MSAWRRSASTTVAGSSAGLSGQRAANGDNPAEAASRLRFIQRAKELGFTLRETEELLTLRDSPAASMGEVKERARHKLADIDARVRDLIEMRAQLAALSETCDGAGLDRCSILAAIDSTPPTKGETDHHG